VTRGQRRALLAIVAVALVLRVAWCVYAAEQPAIGDPAHYHLQAVMIAEGDGYNSATVHWRRLAAMITSGADELPGRDVPTAIGPPGYPALLGALFWAVIRSPLPDNFVAAAVALNIALGVATVVMVFELVRRLFDVRAGLVAAALVAVYPNLVFHTATMHWETAFIFVLTAALLVLLGRPWPGGRVPPRRLLAFAGLLGVSALVRPIAWPLVLLLALGVWREGAGLRLVLTQCAVVVAVVALVLVPWTVRNLVKLDSPVIVSTGYGAALCMARHPGATGRNAGHGSMAELRRMRRYCIPSMVGVPLEEQEVRENEYAAAQAREFVVDDPLREVRSWPTRLRFAYRDDHDALDDVAPFIPRASRRTLATLGDAYFFTVLGLGAVGAVVVARGGSGPRLFLLLTATALALTPILLYGAPRYKVPATPLFAMLAAVGLVATVARNTVPGAGTVAGATSSAPGTYRGGPPYGSLPSRRA
jgi:hypothetical protein